MNDALRRFYLLNFDKKIKGLIKLQILTVMILRKRQGVSKKLVTHSLFEGNEPNHFILPIEKIPG